MLFFGPSLLKIQLKTLISMTLVAIKLGLLKCAK